MAEVPRAVADVDVGVREVRDAEAAAAGVLGDALCRARRQLHQSDRPRTRAGVGIELALRFDHRGQQRGVELVLLGVDANVRRVAQRIPEPRVPRRLAPLQVDERAERRDDDRGDDDPAPQDRRSSSSTPATKASSSSREPSLTYVKSARRSFSSSGTSRSSLSARTPRRASRTSGGAVTTTTRSKRASPPVSYSSGISATATSAVCSASQASVAARTLGWSSDSSQASSARSEKTIRPTSARSISPSRKTRSPQRSRRAAWSPSSSR